MFNLLKRKLNKSVDYISPVAQVKKPWPYTWLFSPFLNSTSNPLANPADSVFKKCNLFPLSSLSPSWCKQPLK